VTSQAWPFPSGLMLGFRATAASDAVTVDGEELLEARWFPGRNSPSTRRQAAAWAARTRSTGSCSAPGWKRATTDAYRLGSSCRHEKCAWVVRAAARPAPVLEKMLGRSNEVPPRMALIHS
jgi:hypothetical protein